MEPLNLDDADLSLSDQEEITKLESLSENLFLHFDFRLELKQITGNIQSFSLFPIKSWDELLLKVFYSIKGRKHKFGVGFFLDEYKKFEFLNEDMIELFINKLIDNRLSSIFSSTVKFEYYEVCSSTKPNNTTRKKPLIGIHGKMPEEASLDSYSFLFFSKPVKVQNMNLKGVSKEIDSWDRDNEREKIARTYLTTFTSAFKESIAHNNIKFHCCGINWIRNTKETKRKANTRKPGSRMSSLLVLKKTMKQTLLREKNSFIFFNDSLKLEFLFFNLLLK